VPGRPLGVVPASLLRASCLGRYHSYPTTRSGNQSKFTNIEYEWKSDWIKSRTQPKSEEGGETAGEDDGDMSMPGTYEEEITTARMRARRSRRILASSSVTNKPASKSKAKKPFCYWCQWDGEKTRSFKSTGVPTPIAEDTPDEEDTTVIAPGKEKPQRGRVATRGLSSGTGFAIIREARSTCSGERWSSTTTTEES
jgi:hypothetical protein